MENIKTLASNLKRSNSLIEGIKYKKIIVHILKILITLFCFYLIFRKVNVHSLKNLIINLDVFWFLGSVFLISLEIPIVGVRWARILIYLNISHVSLPLEDIQATNAATVFLGQILPSPAADAVRLYWLHKKGLSLARGALSILMDRLLALYVFLLISLVLVYQLSLEMNFQELSRFVLILTVILSIIGFAFNFLALKIGKKLSLWPRFDRVGRLLIELRGLLASFEGAWIIFMCVCVHSMTILAIFFLGHSLHMPLSISGAGIFMVCMVLATIAPISIGGWGVREFAAISLAKIMPGLSVESATAMSLLFGIVTLLGSLPPMFYWREKLSIRKSIIG